VSTDPRPFSAIPSLQGVSDQALLKVLGPIKENLERVLGLNGSRADLYLRADGAVAPGGETTIIVPGQGAGEPPVLPIPIIGADDITATGTYERIILSWNVPYDYWLAHYEILRSSTSLVGDAVVIGSTTSMVYSDPVGPKKTYYYWIRIVQKTEAGGNAGALPAEGKQASTVDDPSHMLDVLTGQITATQLYADLASTIGLITAASSVPGSVNARDAAIQSQVTALAAIVDGLSGGGEFGAEAFESLEARVTTAEGLISTNAASIVALQADIDDVEDGISGTAVAVSALNTRVTEAEGDISAVASSIETLQTTVGGHTAALQVHAESIDGIMAEYMVKIDTDGKVIGFGLSSGAPHFETLLDSDCSTLDGWSVYTSGGTSSVDAITFDGQSCILLRAAGEPSGTATIGRTLELTERTKICLVARHAFTAQGMALPFIMTLRGTPDAHLGVQFDQGCIRIIHAVTGFYTIYIDPSLSWRRWEFDINWTDQTVDVSLNNAVLAQGVSFEHTAAAPIGELSLYQAHYASGGEISRATYLNHITVSSYMPAGEGEPEASSFIVRADKFAFCLPTGDGAEPVVPFVVGSVGGVPTVGINGQLVVDGSISTNALAAKSVTADIVNVDRLSAISANMGDITGGTMNIGSGAFRIYANGNVDINAGTIRSTNYVAGVSGWRLTRTGALDITNLQCVGAGNIKDLAVSTFKIQEDAVTLPVTQYRSAKLSITGKAVWTIAASVAVDSLMQPVVINTDVLFWVAAHGSQSSRAIWLGYRIIRANDSHLLRNVLMQKAVPPNWTGVQYHARLSAQDDAPLSGANVYNLEVLVDDLTWFVDLGATTYVSQRFISAIGCKR
jgi:hypothetical protein